MAADACGTGRVLPRGRRLVAAVTAGLLLVAAGPVLWRTLADLREAALYRAWSGEGLGFLLVAVDLAAVALLVGAAYALSCVAHGAGHRAPRLVRVVRTGVTTALCLGLLVAFAAAEAVGHTCFRTCAPFPS